MSQTARDSIKLSGLTMVSRVLGLVRDHYQAVFFGTGAVATAWEIAFMLPNMLRNLLAEGVLSQSFIPVYSKALGVSEGSGRRVAGVILSFLFFFLAFVVLLGIVVFPLILPLYIGKSPDDAKLLVYLAQVMFGFIMTASLTAVLAGISNTHRRFVIPALSPIILNLIYIASFLVLDPFHFGGEQNARILAWSVLAGGVLQLLVQAWFVKREGTFPDLSVRFADPALKQIFSLMAPAVVGASMFHLNQLLDIALASYLIPEEEGAVPALRYAHRLIQLPTGIIGVALSTAILPALVAALRAGDGKKNTEELTSAVSFALFLTVPAGIGLYVIGPHIINLLFYGGAWGVHSTASTWAALQFYCLGVPFYSLNKILTSSFYAHSDTRTPVRLMMTIVPVNFILNILLIPFLRQGGLAMSTSICAALTTLILGWRLQRTIPWDIPRLSGLVLRQLPVWTALLVILAFVEGPLAGYLDFLGANVPGSAKLLPRHVGLVHVLAGGVGGGLLVLGLARLLGLREMAIIVSTLRRKRAKA